MQQKHSFYNLDPDKVMSTCEKSGFSPTGQFTQLNSYENRVFDIQLEGQDNIIAKFYRPGRWPQSTIQDEHDFLFDLKSEGIHCISPILLPNGNSIIEDHGLFVSFFPKIRGRMPDEFLGQGLYQVGQLLAKVHNIGEQKDSPHRPFLDSTYYGGWETLDDLQDWISPEVRHRYNTAAEKILLALDHRVDKSSYQRIHGDCHRGNLLHNGQEFYLVDFDDCMVGPVIQDFWMLLSGDLQSSGDELQQMIAGYETLRHFPDEQIPWIPILRGYRVIGYAGWISRRWEDASFRNLFSDFESYTYWVEETEALEKIAWSLG